MTPGVEHADTRNRRIQWTWMRGERVNRRATYSIIPSFKAITTALTRSSV
jgi:hypothetical protein